MNQPPPISEQREHYAQLMMTDVWDIVGKHKDRLAAYEICGILHNIIGKIEFDMNVRAANEEVKRMRDANKPSPLIDKNGFPI